MVLKTGRMLVIDVGTCFCGYSAELIASVTEKMRIDRWRAKPARIALPDAPAPSSNILERHYYFSAADVVNTVKYLVNETN